MSCNTAVNSGQIRVPDQVVLERQDGDDLIALLFHLQAEE